MKCTSCKTNMVGNNKHFCENCWDWITNKMGMGDLAVIVSMIAQREPNNIEAVKIRNFIVANNYQQGKAKLE